MPLARQRHAREHDDLGHLQAQRAGARRHVGFQGGIGGQHQVGTEQLGGLLAQGLPHAVDEKADRRDGGHGNDQRHQQQTQLATAPVTFQ